MIFKKVTFPFLFIVAIAVSFTSCNSNTEQSEAERIIKRTIQKSGGDIVDNAKVTFRFRDKYYRAVRQEGRYQLMSCTDPDCSSIKDVVTNEGFTRYEKSKAIKLPDSLSTSYAGSVNSVHYFAMLPYGLDSPSVHKELLGESSIKGKDYYEVKVTFDEQGGGEDFQDEYMYWINKTDFTVDYLAYNYQVNEGGTRFREAYNTQVINGVRFVDYNNFKPEEQYPPLKDLDSLFQEGKLELLSKIELKDITVSSCPNC